MEMDSYSPVSLSLEINERQALEQVHRGHIYMVKINTYFCHF